MASALTAWSVLLCCVMSISNVSSFVSWRTYCNCLNAGGGSLDKDSLKNCFKRFFKEDNPELKKIIKDNRDRKEECFMEGNDDDDDCKVVRRFQLSLKFRRDIADLVRSLTPWEASAARPVMYKYWSSHPDIHAVCDERAHPIAMLMLLKTFSTKTFADLKTGDMEVNGYASAIGENSLGAELKMEVRRLCYDRNPSDTSPDIKNFCDLDVIQRVVKKMKKFTDEAKASKWKDGDLRKFFDALRLNFVAYIEYSSRARDQIHVSHNERINGYKNNINTIIGLVEGKHFDELKMLTEFLPTDILTCGGSHVTTTEACYFKRILDQLVTHFELSGVKINGTKRIMLSTAINYERLLEYRQMNRILVVVQQNQFTSIKLAEDITNSNNQRFVELKNYFLQLESFSNNKATKDVEFIDGWIQRYSTSVGQLVTETGDSLGNLLTAAVAGAIAEVAEKAAAMALAIAEACNPLKSIFGGSSLGDIASATAEWTTAMGELNMAKNLKDQLKTLIEKSKDLGERFSKNSDVIQNVMSLIRDAGTSDSVEFEEQKRLFIQSYGDYNPAVQRPELEATKTYWTEVVTSACNIVIGLGTTTGTIVSSAQIKKDGTCWRLPVSIAKMFATYEEIYDFQFDMMETLASSMRAKIGKREAENIASKFESFPERENDDAMRYRSVYTLSYLTYNIQTWNAIEAYCNKLQYAEGGVKPSECQGERTDVPTLMSRRKRVCTGDTKQDVRIPIKPAGNKDKAFLNLTNLYKGEDVSFKVGNKQWLVDNEWMKSSEASKAIYVKDFEVFLPTVTDGFVTYISTSIAMGENALNLCEDCPQFIIPNVERETKFEEGYDASCSGSQRIKNPYSICRSNPLPEDCRLTTRNEDVPGTLYPSVLALWKIRIDGYQDTPIPEPANEDMFIKAKITYCSMSNSSKRSLGSKKSSEGFKRARKSRFCCDGENYYSRDAERCTKCPKGSEPNLHGYYCEKNNDAIMVE